MAMYHAALENSVDTEQNDYLADLHTIAGNGHADIKPTQFAGHPDADPHHGFCPCARVGARNL